jgi:glucokinase
VTRSGTGSGPGRRQVAAADALAVLDDIRRVRGDEGVGLPPLPLDGARRRAAMRSLERRGLIERIDRGGRRPTGWRAVEPMPRALVLAVDVGGTNVRAALSNVRGELVARRAEPTSGADLDALLRQVVRLHAELRSEAGQPDEAVCAAAVGLPGSYDPGRDRIWNVGNLAALTGARPAAAFAEALGLPVAISQDVRLAALGERWKGSARGVDDAAVIWIGTGIAVGLIADGSLLSGGEHTAGEISRLPLGSDPFDEAHRRLGAFEDLVSGPALARSVAASTGWAGPTGDARVVFELAARGDAVAADALRSEARHVALGIAAIVAVTNPSIAVLGGGIGTRPELLPLVRDQLSRLCEDPPIVETSRLGNDGPLYGGVALALALADVSKASA